MKDTLRKSLEQHLDDIFLEKARKAYPIGTERIFGGKNYIKTTNGWRLKPKKMVSESKDIQEKDLGIKISDFGDKTKEMYKDAKEDKHLLHNFVEQLIMLDFPAKDIYSFIKKEFKLSTKLSNYYEDYLGVKAYWKYSENKFSDSSEVANWLHEEAQKITKIKNKYVELTLNPNQTRDLVKEFQKRYEFDSYVEAEKILKGLAHYGTKEYAMAFDTNFGQYHFYIEKRKQDMDKGMEKKKAFIDWFEKSKKGYDVGTIKEFGGKKYIKTNNGWKYYGNKSQSQKKETKEDKKDTPTVEYLQQMKKWAEKASITALKDAIQSKNVEDSVKEIAKEEILKRKQKLKETEAQVKKEETASKQVKKITQTYVKVNGDQIIIKMKNESQYKATKGSFKLESEVGEDLVSFKKKVIESYSNKDKTEQKDKIVEQPSKKTTLHFDDNYERDSYLKKSAHYDLLSNETKAIIKEQLEKRTDKIKKTIGNEDFDKIYKPIFLKIKDKMSLTNFYRDILREYGDTKDEINRVCINKALVELGYAPIANGLLFKRYGNTTYIDYSMYHHYALNDKYDGSRYKTIDNSTQDERDSLSLYTGSSYPSFRRCLNGNPYKNEMSKYESHIENITKMIDKNRLTDNIVLVRRLEFKGTNNLNKWLSLEEGDIIVDKSFTSFSLTHQTFFGNDFSITLLAKKGDPVMNALNSGELEYIVQRGTKFKVLEKGLNSVVVTIV